MALPFMCWLSRATPRLTDQPLVVADAWTWPEFEAMYKRLSVDINGVRGDEAGFDRENVAVYGVALTKTGRLDEAERVYAAYFAERGEHGGHADERPQDVDW